jgi:hypothetical protein
MSYELGAVKWLIGMLLTPVGYVSLYIFGDGIWNTVTHFQAIVTLVTTETGPAILLALAEIYIPTPESMVSSLVIYPLVGGTVGALLWYKGSKF